MLVLRITTLSMKLSGVFLAICISLSFSVVAQPVWSPAKRAELEMEWMRDSLHLTAAQEKKVNPVATNFQKQMDAASGAEKKQQELMRKKDAAMRRILNREQYKLYYRREQEIRSRPKPDRGGKHQAY